MDQKWQRRSWDIHRRFLELSRAKGSLTSDDEIVKFLALAICGEAGELANMIKKRWQGDKVDYDLLRDEIADIRIYLEHLAHHLRIDLDEACDAKLDVVAARLAAKEQAAAGEYRH
jgi:NTP pyrophosphatase (non-canonical NTP hydrolase)